MRLVLVIQLLFLLSASLSSSQPHSTTYVVEPVISASSGNTSYDMDFREPGLTGYDRTRSELVFPLDVTLGGLRLGMAGAFPNGRRWQLAGSITIDLGDPDGNMVDSDWMTFPDGVYTKFSYTESPATVTWLQLQLDGRVGLIARPKFMMDLLAGIRYQRLEQEIIGYRGWQMDDERVVHLVGGHAPAIFYRVRYTMPHTGFGVTALIHPSFTVDATAAGSIVFASDFDDHLLRFKTAEASGLGYGFLGTLRAEYALGEPEMAVRPILIGGVDYTYVNADIDQVQTWYGDDAAGEGDETGLSISNIPHKITSSQLQISIRLGLRF